MARLMRKARRNRVRVAQRNQSIKLLNKKPVIKKIDVEELKKESGSNTGVVAKAAKEVKEEVKKVVEKVTGKGEEKKSAEGTAE